MFCNSNSFEKLPPQRHCILKFLFFFFGLDFGLSLSKLFHHLLIFWLFHKIPNIIWNNVTARNVKSLDNPRRSIIVRFAQMANILFHKNISFRHLEIWRHINTIVFLIKNKIPILFNFQPKRFSLTKCVQFCDSFVSILCCFNGNLIIFDHSSKIHPTNWRGYLLQILF